MIVKHPTIKTVWPYAKKAGATKAPTKVKNRLKSEAPTATSPKRSQEQGERKATRQRTSAGTGGGAKRRETAGKTRSQGAEDRKQAPGDLPNPARSAPPPVRARNRQWRDKFLEQFQQTGIIMAACRSLGISREAVKYARSSSPEFEAKFQTALETANETLEAQALHIATVGQADPIFSRDNKGNPVKVFDRVRKSERILELLLRARMPNKYRERVQQEIVGPGGLPLPFAPTQVQIVIPDNFRDRPEHLTVPQITPSPVQPSLSEPQPEYPVTVTETDDQRRARIEFQQIDSQNREARERIKSHPDAPGPEGFTGGTL